MDDQRREAITVREAAARLGISVSAAYRAAQHGTLPSFRVGGRRLVPLAQLERLLEGKPCTATVADG